MVFRLFLFCYFFSPLFSLLNSTLFQLTMKAKKGNILQYIHEKHDSGNVLVSPFNFSHSHSFNSFIIQSSTFHWKPFLSWNTFFSSLHPSALWFQFPMMQFHYSNILCTQNIVQNSVIPFLDRFFILPAFYFLLFSILFLCLMSSWFLLHSLHEISFLIYFFHSICNANTCKTFFKCMLLHSLPHQTTVYS